MPRNISFAMTPKQILAQKKTVTRRLKWESLEPHTILQPVLKCIGLKKGEKIQKLGCTIRATSVRREPLNVIDKADCIAEGFPEMNPIDFVNFLCNHYKCQPDVIVTRIEFEYLEVDNG